MNSLDREEYVEQAYFFRTYRERLADNVASQEILSLLKDEILSTTRLPMALDFLKGELMLNGRLSDGMQKLKHYFTPFQAFVMTCAEKDRTKFDQVTALEILQYEAEYRASDEPDATALFVYQFESISRNRLGYFDGMQAIADDPFFNDEWRSWILKIRPQLGTIDFAELIFRKSEYAVELYRQQSGEADYEPPQTMLFGKQEGRIARANRGKDPLYMFAALQRHLGYPKVPRPDPPSEKPLFDPHVDQRFYRLEQRLGLLESETKGTFDISEYYKKPGGDSASD